MAEHTEGMTLHEPQMHPIYGQITDDNGHVQQIPIGKQVTCPCGLATGSVPGGGWAESVYAAHLDTIAREANQPVPH